MAEENLSLPLTGGEGKRRCRKCWVAKSIDEFERRGSGRRRGRTCKECRNATRDPIDNRRRVKEWQQANPEKKREYSRRNHESRRSDVTRWPGVIVRSIRARCK